MSVCVCLSVRTKVHFPSNIFILVYLFIAASRGVILEDSVKSKILIYCSCLLMEINGPICNKGSKYPGNSLVFLQSIFQKLLLQSVLRRGDHR